VVSGVGRPSQDAAARLELVRQRLGRSTKHKAVANYNARLEDLLQIVNAHLHKSGSRRGGSRLQVEALNRAALVLLTANFQAFVQELFEETWTSKSLTNPGYVITRLRFSNPSPDEIDNLFSITGVAEITKKAEPRKTASGAGPPKVVTKPVFAREQSSHQARQVVAEMVKLRHSTVHGASGVSVVLRDVTVYIADTAYLATGMSDVL
jgi:hypothetical protein